MTSPTTPPPAGTTQASGNVLSIISIVCGVISVLFIPILFGVAGLVLGFVARSRGERLATIGIIVSAVGLVLGLILGYIVLSNS